MIQAEHGCGAALHSHETEEVFMPLVGPWAVFWRAGDGQNEITLQPFDCIHVPVGVFLSSGLDSTIIAGLAARHTPRLRSFTVGFSDNPDLSELALAGETAKRFGLQHTEVQVTAQDALDAAGGWLGAIDQPSMDGLNVYLISRAVRAQGIKVVLSGQGGDELFGGYPSFADVPRLQRMMRKLAWLPAPLRAASARLYPGGTAVRQ